MSAATWMKGTGEYGLPLMLEMADKGYDVWIGNNRGSEYAVCMSDVAGWWGSTSCGDQNYDSYKMALFDDPAIIDKVREVSGQPKVTYIGYSMGTNQMHWSLLEKTEEGYYNERLHNFIALAPCVDDNAIERLGEIQSTTVHYIVAEDDDQHETCYANTARRAYSAFATPNKSYQEFAGKDHGFFYWASSSSG